MSREQEESGDAGGSIAISSPPQEQMGLLESTVSAGVPMNLSEANKTMKIVYAIFVLHGIGVLMPWNMFLTIAPDYYIGYKFNPVNETQPDYAKYFFSYLGVCSQIPNLLLNMINLFVVLKSSLRLRIIGSLAVVTAVVFTTIVFIFVPTHSWMAGFFVFTMITVVILNSANGVYQNSVYGLLADFPQNFSNAVVTGNNICGIFVTLVLIIFLIVSSNEIVVATSYFSIALVTILMCLGSLFVMPKIPFYKYYVSRADEARAINTVEQKFTLADRIHVLKETWPQMLSIFFTFFVTLALFPAVVSDIRLYPYERYGTSWDFVVPKQLYIPITTFLNFNVFATLGNILANFVQWPKSDKLIYPVLARLLFIPFFLFCNYTGNAGRNGPVYFTNEWSFIFTLSLMAFTQGYFSSLGMIAISDTTYAQVAGMMSGVFLVLGITVGVAFTFVEAYIFIK